MCVGRGCGDGVCGCGCRTDSQLVCQAQKCVKFANIKAAQKFISCIQHANE